MDTETVLDLVRSMKENYKSGVTKTGKYVDFNLYEHVEKIHAYTNAKHISGDKDDLGRDKPFFDITTAATNIWYRATDIDRKDIRIKSTRSKQAIQALVANVLLQRFMNKEDFGRFLNRWGMVSARNGSAIVKTVEHGDDLHISVIPWNKIICDAVDFDSNPQIEVLYLTPAQLLRNEAYDKTVVKSLLESKTSRKLLDGSNVDSGKNDFIEVYEVHGELPLSYLTDNDDDKDTYVQQMHVVSFFGKANGEYDNFTLYKGREEKSPYTITHLLEEEGRVIGKGAVEYLFDAQWMVNHTSKLIKDNLELISKMVFQTSDPSFVGKNIFTDLESGDILNYTTSPLSVVPNNPTNITYLQNYGMQFQNLAKEITSTPDAISGNTMPSGTAYRQVAVLNRESHSLFEQMIETKGLYLERLLRERIIPYIKKHMDTSEEMSAVLSDQDIQQLDSMFIDYKSNEIRNEALKDQILNKGVVAEDINIEDIKSTSQGELAKQGNQRFIIPSEIDDTTWKDMLKDFEWDVEINISGESSDKEVAMTTLTTALQTIATNPMVLQDPNGKLIFNKILETSGVISPIQLSYQQPQPQPQQQQLPTPTTQS